MTTAWNRFARGHCLAYLLLLALALGGFTCARAESFMTVGDVSVDVTAKNAAAARDQAIADVQRKAFDRLIKRLVPNPADQARLKPSQADIESFVQDFGVQSERSSPVRYIGLYSVRFRASRIHKYLADAGVTSVKDLPQVLIVPILKAPTGHLLWEQGNGWRAAWERGGFGDGPVTLILPNADPFDTGSLSAAAAEAGDIGPLSALLRRYHATGIVVAVAEPRDAARGVLSGLTVTATTYDLIGQKGSQVLTIDPAAGEQPEKILLRGVASVADALENNWAQSIAATGSTGLSGLSAASAAADSADQPSTGGVGTVYSIAMPLSGLADWVKARDQLGSMPGVQRLSLDALTRDEAALTLDFAGDPLALQVALASSGYVLVQTAPANAAGPGSFQLRRAGASRTP